MSKVKWIDPQLFNFILEYVEDNQKMPKAFLSGAITNRIDSYKEYFDEAKECFDDIGIDSYNPATIDIDTPWEVAMEETLSQMETCEFMYVLKNWENSKGVEIEIEQAKRMNMPIFFE